MKEKNSKIVEEYKDMLIYYKDGVLCFGNRKYTRYNLKSIRSCKNRITRYVNSLNKREKRSMKYLKYKEEF